MDTPIWIAIDGPAGSGKTTIGKLLALKLNYKFVDSGLLYRAVTYYFLKVGINVKEFKASYLESIKLEHKDGSVCLNNENITSFLYSKEVENNVSEVSKIKEIRNFINKILKSISLNSNIVMVGRDIGTVVLKEAILKIFLSVDEETRKKRRLTERKRINAVEKEIAVNIKKRDLLDSTRKEAPLKFEQDYILIDNSSLPPDEIVNIIMNKLKERVKHDI